ncbi:splicing factor C9orf78 homolog isoform X1 [Cylas formicarius]|uniref:splicing factor C9orf78 homolog isoform X1 n=2 Tax=Cylas formicarius TaxID=197179 RepID=UPI0029586DBA|nr:splicing factor C9orf78 homolog isoform X1 [Cylas formicarius]XP_060535544.1 splicing factor C9orf78 homolog isoform X1 [Cylas formicarius]XP_060535545.1 splicing factor C9orf78 homolog isoform X1 [Cylas formicarius]
MSHSEEVLPEKIEFKAKKRKNLRQRVKLEESDDEEIQQVNSKLEEMKELQSLRKRPNGVSVIGLALGTKVSAEEEVVAKDPFKVQAGGMVNMQALKQGKVKQVDDAYDTGIGTQFSVETNKRDEDEEMMKFIEEELSKRKGKIDPPVAHSFTKNKSTYLSPEEAALQAVPEHLRESSTKRSEEMLSNQMLSGIPEVDLGIEAKIKNIEATEEAKLRLLWEKQNKKDGPSQFVPTNMAVNFVQHNRFNVDHSEIAKKRAKVDAEKPKKKTEKATDDYHFEKFKKQFRR